MLPVVSSIRKDADLGKMKFLVLALCVCAASAASFNSGAYKPWQQQQQVAKAVAQVVQSPTYTPVFPARTYTPKVEEVVVPIVPKPVVKPVVAAAKTVYTTGKDGDSETLRADSKVDVDGFNYYYETTNGIAAQSSGVLKNVDNENVLIFQGSYQYIAPDGTPVQFSYVADENGYQPKSNLLPVAPPVPEAIARSLEYLRTHPPKPENY